MKTRFGKSAACVLATLLLLSSVPSMGRDVGAAEDLPGNPEIEIKDQARGANASYGLSGVSFIEDTWGDCPVTFDGDTGLLTVGAGTLSQSFPGSIDKSSIKVIELAEGVKAPADCRQLFYPMMNLEEIQGHLDTSGVTNMIMMFFYCSSLVAVDVSLWDTRNVTDMNGLFSYCHDLLTLDVSGWDTSNVTDMGSMFSGCYRLADLDVSSWDTSNVTDMGSIFSNCWKVSTLDVSGWDTHGVTDMHGMFLGVDASTLDVSGWDTSSVTTMSFMFTACRNLTSLEVSDWNTENVTAMDGMFSACESLTSLDLSGWDTGKVTDMYRMFHECSNLSSLDVSSWDTRNVTSMALMFDSCASLETIDVSVWDTGSVEDMYWMFQDCENLAFLDVSGWDTSSVTTMWAMFSRCRNLDSLDVSGWNTGNVRNMNSLFDGCRSLSTLGVSGWDTSSATEMWAMFRSCSNLDSLDLSSWDTSCVTIMNAMFSYCSGLSALNISNWDTGEVTSMNTMFAYCGGLPALDVSGWDTSSVKDMYGMFAACNKLASLDVTGWDTSSVTNMRLMFSGANALRYLTLGTKSIFDEGTALPLISTWSGIFTGRWIRVAPESPVIAYENSTEFMQEYDGTHPGMYTWETDPNARFDVVFEVDGGSAVPPQEIGYGGLVTKPDDPTKDGYLFSGWYLDEAHKVLYDFTTPVTDSLTLYAKWAINLPDFPDVPSDKWHYSYVNFMASLGIVSGWGTTGMFMPDNKVIREHAAKMICGSADLPLGGMGISFKDYAAINPTLILYIRALMTKGAIGGFPDNTFRPRDNIKRSHACKMVAVAFDLQPGDLAVDLNDLPANQELRDAIITLASNGIVGGYGTTGEFRPDNEISRAELSKILCVTMAVSAVQRAEQEGTLEAIQAAQAILDALPYDHIPETIDDLQARLDAIASNG